MALRCPTGSSIRRSLIFDPNSRSSFFGNICTSTFSACPVQNIFHLLLGYIAPGDTTPWWGTSSTIWYDTPTGHRLYPSILSSKKVQQNWNGIQVIVRHCLQEPFSLYYLLTKYIFGKSNLKFITNPLYFFYPNSLFSSSRWKSP